jgi:hypothetical protein
MKSARAVEDEINLNAFYKEFIRPGRGSANVIAGAADPTTKRAWLVSSPDPMGRWIATDALAE